jgi:hypothetical protein
MLKRIVEASPRFKASMAGVLSLLGDLWTSAALTIWIGTGDFHLRPAS